MSPSIVNGWSVIHFAGWDNDESIDVKRVSSILVVREAMPRTSAPADSSFYVKNLVAASLWWRSWLVFMVWLFPWIVQLQVWGFFEIDQSARNQETEKKEEAKFGRVGRLTCSQGHDARLLLRWWETGEYQWTLSTQRTHVFCRFLLQHLHARLLSCLVHVRKSSHVMPSIQ